MIEVINFKVGYHLDHADMFRQIDQVVQDYMSSAITYTAGEYDLTPDRAESTRRCNLRVMPDGTAIYQIMRQDLPRQIRLNPKDLRLSYFRRVIEIPGQQKRVFIHRTVGGKDNVMDSVILFAPGLSPRI